MATKYELPEEVNEKRLRTLGMEVEMKTFKTNVPCKRWFFASPRQEEETCELGDMKAREIAARNPSEIRSHATERETSDDMKQQAEIRLRLQATEGKTTYGRLVKIFCAGDCTRETKAMFIEDYLQTRPENRSPIIRVGSYFKLIRRLRSEVIKLHLKIFQIDDYERFHLGTFIYHEFSLGALVFWDTRNPSSLDGAIKWRQNFRKMLRSIPCVLVTDNTAKPGPLQWIGPGKIFESEVALDEFCKDHGFVDHFEIKSRDWESGEKSVFGQAVNSLLDEIFGQGKKKK